jgi:hypothetical protein
MPASLSPPFRKLAAAAVVLVAAGATVAGVATASASPAAHRTAATYHTDHQLCYTVASATPGGFVLPGTITLKNQFSTKGFKPTISTTPVLHCNPVKKILPSGQVFPITNPAAHLLCFGITAPTTQPTPLVSVTNQFGTADLQPAQPNMLCLPTWKSLTAPPDKAKNHPPGLSHYTCYPVTVKSGAYTPPGTLMLKDEFTPKPVPMQINPTPDELCLPTVKIVTTPTATKTYGIVAGAMHLLCFPTLGQTPIKSPVFDQNQFAPSPPGGVAVNIARTFALCLPSTKKILG